MSFKQLCTPIAAITGPWNCVLYRRLVTEGPVDPGHCHWDTDTIESYNEIQLSTYSAQPQKI